MLKLMKVILYVEITLLLMLIGTACTVGPVTQLLSSPLSAQESSSPLSIPTAILTDVPTTTPVPAQTGVAFSPYFRLFPIPAATTSRALALAFIAGDWERHSPDSLWVASLDGSGERRLAEDVSHVKWSPDGDLLACVHQGSLWVVSPDGTKAWKRVPMDEEKGAVVLFSWAPGGKRIAFVQRKQWGSPEYLGIVSNKDGRLSYLITAEDHSASQTRFTEPVWSPDEQWIAFFRYDLYQLQVVHVSDAMVASLPFCGGFGGGIEALSWSPLGDRLALWFYGNGRYAHGSVCVSTLDGQETALDVGGDSTNPVWGTDGQSLYVLATNFNPNDPDLDLDPRLLRFTADGQYSERLAPLKSAGSLSLSPNGVWLSILFGADNNPTFQIVSCDGTEVIMQKIRAPGAVLYAQTPHHVYSWDPDSHHLVFLAGQYNTPDTIGVRQYGAIYALDFRTGELTRLTNDHWIKEYSVSPASD